ncbi:MAG: response regulator [Deltaproteobacteria bacterium]|nr:response regulator [Deltaproteobacteria bacterium]
MDPKIMIIDDEEDFIDLTATMLRFHDLDVDAVTDPREVHEKLQAQKYALIVTDLMMPHIDGFTVVDQTRKMDQYKTTPIIVLTAKTLTEEERKRLHQHDVHFLVKPFEPQGLVDLIRNLLDGG